MTALVPFFTVIMATWGRERHILPSITSVLQQDFPDFELIVVGDACTDQTEAVVTGITDVRVRWLNLTTRCGSQSAPNNAGIAAARGKVIAYLGHDDIWEPTHLQHLARCFLAGGPTDFVVSGLINHLPGGLSGSAVMGLFTDDSARGRNFFPPSSFAHRKDVTDRIGPWGMPMDLRAPVDADLLLRANAADLRFVSTGVVTVHKFSSADRYLSYVEHRSDEQSEMLATMTAPDHAARVAAIVDQARRLGRFMQHNLLRYDLCVPGEIARINARRRGLLRPKVQPLEKGVTLHQRREDCALDWRVRPLFGIRLHTRNPRPRLLLPFAGAGAARMGFRAIHPDRSALLVIEMRCNDESLTTRPARLRRSIWGWSADYETVIPVNSGRASVIEFRLSQAQRAKFGIGRFQIGFGIGKLWLKPKAP